MSTDQCLPRGPAEWDKSGNCGTMPGNEGEEDDVLLLAVVEKRRAEVESDQEFDRTNGR